MMIILMSPFVGAHEWTPTYPKMKPSFVSGVSVTTMQIFNKRREIGWYKITVWDEDFTPVPHSISGGSLQKVSYLQRKSINVYVRRKDLGRAVYVCSESKAISYLDKGTFVSSRICSKLK